jgi:trehalose synthase-fused probable maltokinase
MGMADRHAGTLQTGIPEVSSVDLGHWLARQRWFSGKARELGAVGVLDALVLAESGPEPLVLLIVEVRAPSGTHDLYQVLAGVARERELPEQEQIGGEQGGVLYDALLDERQTATLGRLIASDATVVSGSSTVSFQGSDVELAEPFGARRLSGEQSNSSVVLDERFIVKAFRRIEAGINPEHEMLGFLSAHGFENVARVEGSWAYRGELLDANLGIMQRFVPDARDGWQLALEALERGDGGELIAPISELGAVTGRMHVVLAGDPEDPEFAPEEPADEHVALLTATIDEQIERLFVQLPDRPGLAPIAGRGEELRDRLALLSHTGVGGRLIRAHGDYHLGQALLAPDGWTVIDFEGEPGRPLRERRRKRSPLRDVAGMLRSISYASLAGEVMHGAPPDREWEQSAREGFLRGYMDEIDPTLLPAGTQAIAKQLATFELEKVLYELRYELENRPDWVIVPVTGIERLLAEDI